MENSAMTDTIPDISDWLDDQSWVWISIHPATNEIIMLEEPEQSIQSFLTDLDTFRVLPSLHPSARLLQHQSQVLQLPTKQELRVNKNAKREDAGLEDIQPHLVPLPTRRRQQRSESPRSDSGSPAPNSLSSSPGSSGSGKTCSINTNSLNSHILASGLPPLPPDVSGDWPLLEFKDDFRIPFAPSRENSLSEGDGKGNEGERGEDGEGEESDEEHFEYVRNTDQVSLAAFCTAVMVMGLWAIEHGVAERLLFLNRNR
ncbi:hypothetical protein B0J14DRAFT_705298 [Halenospora varia]|nr:hypothetical protein B0J14DRAFT_705298 [Halenospora varia]